MQKKLSLKWLILVYMISGLWAAGAFARPASVEVSKELKLLQILIQKPMAQRQLPSDLTKKYMRMAQSKNAELQLIGVVTLAFADDTASLELVKRLASDTKNIERSGAANYTVLMREHSQESKQDLLNALSSRLAQSKNPWERMFIANRIAVDFKQQSMNLLLKAIKLEPVKTDNPRLLIYSGIAKSDMLYYLSHSDDLATLKEIAFWDPNADFARDSFFPASIVSLMSALTPNRPSDPLLNSWPILIFDARKKLEKFQNQ